MFTIEASAKINLIMEVLGKRPDGYHEIRGVIQAINFCDSLQIAPDKGIQFRCNMPGWTPEQSLTIKAVKSLQETTGCAKGAMIKIEKRIPLMSGLGGDSSDAAAVLRGLNQFWELGLPQKKLLELASQLGSDVSFFLYGGTALMEGRGEKITPLPPSPHRWVIIVIPDTPGMPGKTQRAYNMLKLSHYTSGEITERLVTNLKLSRGFTTSELFNTFENVTFIRGAELTAYQSRILKMGAPDVHLAGSGPALFIMSEDRTQAEDLLMRLKNQGMESYLTDTRVCL
jgi:4-diphosphocytidyl-2-C-methyl-D-erythritol kinase